MNHADAIKISDFIRVVCSKRILQIYCKSDNVLCLLHSDLSDGEAAARENEDDIRGLVSDYDMVILTCGMGGGTGTGAAPVVAQIAQNIGVLVVGVVTTPFTFESAPRFLATKNGIAQLEANVDTLLVIPNDNLLSLSDKPLKLEDAFLLADSVLKYTIEGITNIVYKRGTVNIDFSDVKTTLTGKGIGHLGLGIVDEGTPIIDAVKQAINSPLLDTTIAGASNILLNTSGSVDVVSLNEAISYVRETAGMNVNLIWGTVEESDNGNEGKIVVTLIATGMPKEDVREETVEVKLPPVIPQMEPKRDVTKEYFVPQTPGRLQERELLDIKMPTFLNKYK